MKFATEATITETCETTVIVIVEHLELIIQEIKYAKLLNFPQECQECLLQQEARKQKRSRDADIMSDLGNLDVMLSSGE